MKKYITIIIAIALVLGMTQCKKNVETISNAASEGVYITLRVAGDDSRHEVDPNSGEVVYKSGDEIYVGHKGSYVGTLTYASGCFSGTITPGAGDESDYLYFYFLGGLATAPSLSAANQSYTVNISNQREGLPVLSMGQSNMPYSSEVTTYTSVLLNQCALVKISLTEETPSYLNVNGMLVEATINFANHSITPTQTTGTIQMRTQTMKERWAIMLPKATATNTTATIDDKSYTVDVPAILANQHITSGIEINNATPVFTVDDNGTTVSFSKGNLQYNSVSTSWRFADNQYDICQSSYGIYGTWNTSGWVDLFGWGTWGSGQNPLNTSTNAGEYYWSTDFTGIFDGHSWRTLTKDEWQYILDHSTYGMATVNGVHGIVILPDGSSLTVDTTHDNWGDNTYTAEVWAADMESQGAVFLPAAGKRFGSEMSLVGVYGLYWSSTSTPGNEVNYLYFIDSEAGMYNDTRDVGLSVRLVRTVQ